jgi:hypothetical protein
MGRPAIFDFPLIAAFGDRCQVVDLPGAWMTAKQMWQIP